MFGSKITNREAYVAIFGDRCFKCGAAGEVRNSIDVPLWADNFGNFLIMCEACHATNAGFGRLAPGGWAVIGIIKKAKEMEVLGYRLSPEPKDRANVRKALKLGRARAKSSH